jgi:hypothetical protein
VADPDRPKNDKATILGDSVQVVKELRAEVKRLKCEQTTLLDESRDVSLSHLYLCPITSWKNTKILKVVQIVFWGNRLFGYVKFFCLLSVILTLLRDIRKSPMGVFGA